MYRATRSFRRAASLTFLLLPVAPGNAAAQEAGAPLQARDTSFVEVRQRVLNEITDVLETRAFSVTGEFTRWPEVYAAHSDAIAAAGNEAEFVAAVNRALGAIGATHVSLRGPSQHVRGTETMNAGVRAVVVPDGLLVTRVYPGGPADGVGVRAGDVIAKVDGQPAASRAQLESAVEETRTVEILKDATSASEGSSRTATLLLQPIPRFWPIEVVRLDEETTVVIVDWFQTGYEPAEVSRLLSGISTRNVIIDLRDNPGGAGFYSHHFVCHFLPAESVLGTYVSREELATFIAETGRPATDLAAFVAWNPRVRKCLPGNGGIVSGMIAVLVNGATTSAAEIAAQTLKDVAAAQVVGTHTPGAVLGAEEQRLAGGYRLWFPSIDYISPGGHRVEGRGVAPDLIWNGPRRIVPGTPDPAWLAARDHLRAGRL